MRQLVLVVALASSGLHAQPMPRTTDEQIMREASLVTSSGRVDLYEHRTSAPPELAALADRAIFRMEAILGRAWDTATLGERVSVFVSLDTRVSHVLGGYEHQKNPRPVIFLNPMVAQMALSGRNATYAHELAHLLTWRFYSHSLREGLATFLALELHPGAGVGPNREGYGTFPPVVAGVRELLGSSAPPPVAVVQDPTFRASYYASSYRLVRHLVEVGGLAKVLDLYAAPDPDSAFKQFYGQDRSTLVAAALK